MNQFESKLQNNQFELKKSNVEVLQINMGKLCNLTCVHCHVEAGPTKTQENMSCKTAEAVVGVMDRFQPTTLDLTGGAPEMNENFRYLIEEALKRDIEIIDRSNLTVFYEPDYDWLPKFLAQNKVKIVASLPCYSQENVDKQRGRGTFGQSIEALLWLNRLGYGEEGSGLQLDLVYNPVGAHLPPEQSQLEREYKNRLKEDFGIKFNALYTITNMPITRYEKYLKATGELEAYRELLVNNFNAATIEDLMCRNTLSVSWDGFLYDCDFNQMLDMKIQNGKRLTVFDITPEDLRGKSVVTADHCFGCTAGAGSSCQGALKESLQAQQ